MTIYTSKQNMEILNGWCPYHLGELATYWNGRAFKPEEWANKGRPIIRIENLNSPNALYNFYEGNVRSENEVVDGDLLVSWSASLDAYWWDRGHAVLNQHIFKVEENKEIVRRRFLYYLLRNAMSKIRERVHGATMQHITKPEFEKIEVPVPPLKEQDRINGILDVKLAAVEVARRAAEGRTEAASALFDAFVRSVFDSKEAKAWPRKDLLELCIKPGQYGTSRKSNTDGQGLPVLGMYHIYEGRIRWENVQNINLSENEVEKYLLHRYDVLFNRTNSAELVGKSAVYDIDRGAVFASYLVRFRLNADMADPYFVSAYINSHHGRAFIEHNMARAIGQVNISASTMHKMPVPVPELDRQQEFGQMLIERRKQVDSLKASLTAEKGSIDSMPAAILRNAFAGKL